MDLSRSKSKIYFFFQDTKFGLQHRTVLKKFIESIFKKEGRELESLNYIFCTDKSLLKINQQYLQHDDYTDIITFELSPKGEPVLGEIYISVDRVRENARLLGSSFKSEIHRVLFHGALHLCGYKDKSAEEKSKMTARENFYISKYWKTPV